MRNIKLVLAYDGTHYAGWQRQKEQPTIQGLVEENLARMTGALSVLHGAGRTDAGVHALAMVANFTTAAKIPCQGFCQGLNSLLPAAIRILEAEEVGAEFHARYDSVGKSYLYHIVNAPVVLPTDRLYALQVNGVLDCERMRQCLNLLLGEHDFASFEATGSRDLTAPGGRGAVRTIREASLSFPAPGSSRLTFEIKGDGFLRHMVRNIVGTVLEVGRGKKSLADFQGILAARNRALAGCTAPPQGLFLKAVYY